MVGSGSQPAAPCMRVEMRTKPRVCPKGARPCLQWMGRPHHLTEAEEKTDFLPPCSGWWFPGAASPAAPQELGRSWGCSTFLPSPRSSAAPGPPQPPRCSSRRDSSSPATGDERTLVVSSLLGAPWGHLLVRPSSGLGHRSPLLLLRGSPSAHPSCLGSHREVRAAHPALLRSLLGQNSAAEGTAFLPSSSKAASGAAAPAGLGSLPSGGDPQPVPAMKPLRLSWSCLVLAAAQSFGAGTWGLRGTHCSPQGQRGLRAFPAPCPTVGFFPPAAGSRVVLTFFLLQNKEREQCV